MAAAAKYDRLTQRLRPRLVADIGHQRAQPPALLGCKLCPQLIELCRAARWHNYACPRCQKLPHDPRANLARAAENQYPSPIKQGRAAPYQLTKQYLYIQYLYVQILSIEIMIYPMQPSETLWSVAEKDTWLGLIRMMSQVNRRLSAEMEQQDNLPIAWYDVLVHLALAPEAGWSMQELAAQVMMSGSGLTRLVDRMIDAGLVQRQRADERQAEDRRVVRVVLTEAGRALLAQVQPQHVVRVRAYLLQHLSEAELSCIRGACERVLSKLSQEDMAHV